MDQPTMLIREEFRPGRNSRVDSRACMIRALDMTIHCDNDRVRVRVRVGVDGRVPA
jgi:hypothetical protein